LNNSGERFGAMRMSKKIELVYGYDGESSVVAEGFDSAAVCWFKESKKIKSGSCIISLPGGDVKYFVKVYEIPFFKGLVRRCFNHKIKNIWEVHCKLYRQGVDVPKPVALMKKKSKKAVCEYIISEWLEDAEDLRSLESSEDVFILQAARLLAGIHRLGIVHGDFKYANLMYSTQRKELFSVDFDGSKFKSTEPLFSKDVARFLVSMSEAGVSVKHRDGFLHEYAGLVDVCVEVLSGRVAPHIKKIINRHKIKYPERY